MSVVLIALAAVVVLFVLGWIVVGLVLKLLWWALIGIVIGAIARAILPGKQQIGVLATAAAGIAAALLGGIIAHIVGVGSFLQFVIAVVVALVIVGVVSTTETARTQAMSERVMETAGRRMAGQRASLPQALFASVLVGAAASVLTYRFLRSA